MHFDEKRQPWKQSHTDKNMLAAREKRVLGMRKTKKYLLMAEREKNKWTNEIMKIIFFRFGKMNDSRMHWNQTRPLYLYRTIDSSWLEPILCSSSSYWIIFYTWIYRFIVSVFRYANLSFIDATCPGCVGRLDGGSWWFEIFQHSIWFSCDVRRSLLRSGLWKFVPAAWRSIRSLHVFINWCHRLFIRMARRLLHQT